MGWEDFVGVGETSEWGQKKDPVKDVIDSIDAQLKVRAPPKVVPGFSPVDDAKVKALLRAVASFRAPQYLIYNLQVPRSIFRELASPKHHVGTNHMELMTGLIWDRFSLLLSENRSVILGNAFCEFIKSDSDKYKEKMGDEFEWDENLVSMVNGTFSQREGSTKWMVDVDRVYAPMLWADTHWVGLCIELITGNVTVFDSNYKLTKPQVADEIMAPILDMLPLMISDLTADFGASYTPPAVFAYQRPVNVPQDPSSGNSGPLAVKYMELHSQGIQFINLTDKIVENIRCNYAVDVFEQFQFPLA